LPSQTTVAPQKITLSDYSRLHMTQEARESDEFPGFTEYVSKTFHGLFNLTEVPSIHATFISDWEVSLGYPCAFFCLTVSSYIVAMIFAVPAIHTAGWFLVFPFTFLFLIFVVSYVRIMHDGPGYLPFYYPLASAHSRELSDHGSLLPAGEMSPSGIISDRNQYLWAQKQPKPRRCVLSSIGRRIIVRPDHFCLWAHTWIGRRNFKPFLLCNLWGFVYIGSLLHIIFRALTNDVHPKNPFHVAILFSYFFIGSVVFVTTGFFTYSYLRAMCTNTTSWERWNGVDSRRYDQGCVKNSEDVCGSADKWYCWPCPTSPWSGMTNQALIEDYQCASDKDDTSSDQPLYAP
jgi:hypothetical protein